MLSNVLQENCFTKKEAKIYLASLELGNAPASSIARHAWENRVTTYTILKDFLSRWISNEVNKDGVKYYSVIEAKQLIQLQKDKYQKLESILPELLAVTNNYNNKPKVYFYDWLDWLKTVYTNLILDGNEMDKWEPFLTFVWTNKMDDRFMDYLEKEFTPRRLKTCKRKTKWILSQKSDDGYIKYHYRKHEFITIDDPIFDMWNEIIVYWKNKVAICMYSTDELSALIIESQTLHDWLKGMFNLLWKIYKKK